MFERVFFLSERAIPNQYKTKTHDKGNVYIDYFDS